MSYCTYKIILNQFDLQGNNDKIETVGVIYRPPDQKADVNDMVFNEINNIVSRIRTPWYWVILTNHSSEKLLEIIQENFISQNVHEPTQNIQVGEYKDLKKQNRLRKTYCGHM